MRVIFIFLSACVMLAVIKAAVVALFLLFLIALLWGACLHPREVAAFLTYCAILTALSAYPLICLTIIGVAVICAQLGNTSDQPP